MHTGNKQHTRNHPDDMAGDGRRGEQQSHPSNKANDGWQREQHTERNEMASDGCQEKQQSHRSNTASDGQQRGQQTEHNEIDGNDWQGGQQNHRNNMQGHDLQKDQQRGRDNMPYNARQHPQEGQNKDGGKSRDQATPCRGSNMTNPTNLPPPVSDSMTPDAPPTTSHSNAKSRQTVSPTSSEDTQPSNSASETSTTTQTPTPPAPENPPKAPPEAPPSNNPAPQSSNGTSTPPEANAPKAVPTPEANPAPESPPPKPSVIFTSEVHWITTTVLVTHQPPAAANPSQPTPAPIFQLPGLAVVNPIDITVTNSIDLETAPSTVSPPPSSKSEAGERPPSGVDSGKKEQSPTPPVASPIPAQLPSEILPPNPTDASFASLPTTIVKDSPLPSSRPIGGGTSKIPGSLPASGTTPPRLPTNTGGSGGAQIQDGGGGSGPSMSTIIGSAAGGAAALVIAALLLWLWRRRVRQKREEMAGWPISPFIDHQARHDQPPVNTATTGAATAAGMTGAAAAGPFAAGRPASTRALKPLQGWWAGRTQQSGPLIAPQYGGGAEMRQQQPTSTMNLRGGGGSQDSNNPFSDMHSTEGMRTAPVLSPQQQTLRGILKPSPSNAGGGAWRHGRSPSESSVSRGRRSRAPSLSGRGWRFPSSSQQQPPPMPRPAASRRTSSLTNDPFEDRRIKFRSDPFDLELDTRLLPSSLVVAAPPPSRPPPQMGNARASSVYSDGSGVGSHYTSGVSSSVLGGAAAGPGAVGWAYSSDNPTLPLAAKEYGTSAGGVGQAM